MKSRPNRTASRRTAGGAPGVIGAEGNGRRGAAVITAMLAALALLSTALVVLDADRWTALQFYDPESGWPVGQGALWMWLYRYGTVPGLVLALAALVGFGLSFRSRGLLRWRREMLIVLLTAVIGGGVLVNALFKPYWGRPRPRQVAAFGGQYDYRAFYQPGVPGKGQSFPCGHCTMGYLFVSLLVLRRKAPVLASSGAGFGLAYGTLLGLCRIVQGAHFVTDVLWSLGILSLVAASLHYFILPRSDRLSFRAGRRMQQMLAAVSALAVIVIVLAFLTRRPFYETHVDAIPVTEALKTVAVVVEGPLESRQVRFDDGPDLRLSLHARGFGWSLSRVAFEVERRRRGETLTILLRTNRKGYFSELNQQLQISAPDRLQHRLSVQVKEKP